MNNNNIEKLYIFTSKDDTTGNFIPSEITIFYENGAIDKMAYDINVHDKLAKEFLESKGIDISQPDYLSKTIDLFEIHPVNSEKYNSVQRIIKYNIEPEEELVEVKKDPTLTKTQKIIAGGVVGGIAATAGVAMVIDSVSGMDKTQKEIYGVEGLLSQLSVDNERRIFFETVDTVLGQLNELTLDKDVFALEEDKDAVLKFSTDEIISAMIVLNNYSRDELKEIFGDKELNSAEILSNYQKFAFKMSIFSMNGKASSQVSLLIRNEENRTWFETIENALVKFNKKQTNENADKLIRLFAYFYQHGINGTDNLENDEASLNGVKNLILNMMRGYYDANVEEDYRKYLVVSTSPSDFDDKYRENELSQVQKGEKLKFYLNQAEKGVCTISVIEEHINDTIDSLEKGIDEITKIKLDLVDAVSEAEELELAAKILSEGLSDEVLVQFEKSNKTAKNALKVYKDSLSAVDSSMPLYDEIKTAIDDEYGPFEEIKDDVLYNNRIRGLVKINEISNSGNVITKEEWNNMSSEEKIEHAKEHGTVISTTTQTKEEKVEYEDLTPSEKQEVDKQKEEIDNSVAVENAYNAGKADAIEFAVRDGMFSYNFIDPLIGKNVRNDGSLYDFIRLNYIYNETAVTMSDAKIQNKYSSDLASFKKTTKDSEVISSYEKGWKAGMSSILSQALADGKEGRKDFLEAKEMLDKKNQTTTKDEQSTTKKEESTTKKEETTTKQEESTTKKEETTTKKPEPTTEDRTPVVTEKPNKDEVDPNLNPTIADSDDGFEDIYDENYDGYVSSDEMDDVFAYYADEIIEETTKVLRK